MVPYAPRGAHGHCCGQHFVSEREARNWFEISTEKGGFRHIEPSPPKVVVVMSRLLCRHSLFDSLFAPLEAKRPWPVRFIDSKGAKTASHLEETLIGHRHAARLAQPLCASSAVVSGSRIMPHVAFATLRWELRLPQARTTNPSFIA